VDLVEEVLVVAEAKELKAAATCLTAVVAAPMVVAALEVKVLLVLTMVEVIEILRLHREAMRRARRCIFHQVLLLAEVKELTAAVVVSVLAVAVAESFTSGRPLVAEAGTGVGKSLAYLVPAAKFALETGRKGVISTHTINLQEQLVRKDIPIVRKILGEELPAVLLKGRQNYLCPARLRRAWEQSADLFTTTESEELGRIRTWAEGTRDGTLSGMPFQPTNKVWLQVCSEAHSKIFRVEIISVARLNVFFIFTFNLEGEAIER
jgi:hypothetical protein